MEKSASRPFWLTLILFTLIFSLYAALSTTSRAEEAGIVLQRSIWGGMLLVYSATALLCVWLFILVARSGNPPFSASFARFHFNNSFWRVTGWIVFILILVLIPYLKFRYQIGQDVKKPVHAFDPGMLLIRITGVSGIQS